MTELKQTKWQRLKDRFRSSDIARRMASGAMWSFTGTATAKLIVLIAGIACAHVLGQKEYGQFGMVRSTINMFVVFGFAGLGLTATKYIAEFRKTDKEHVGSIYLLTNGFAFVTGLLVTVIVLSAASYLAGTTLKAPELTDSIRVGAFLLFVTVINGAQQGTLSGFEDFKAIALNTLLGSIAESVLMLIGGYCFGVLGAVLGFGMGFVVLYVANNVSIRRNIRREGLQITKQSFRRQDLKLLYKFSLPAALSSMMVTPVYWVVRSMLVRFENFSELAIYEAADQWRIIILFVPMAVSQIVLPILSSISNTDKNKFWKVLYLNIGLNFAISFGFSLLVILFSNYIMQLYGKGYTDTMPLIYLSLSTVCAAIANVVGMSISSRAKMWYGFGFNLLWGCMVIGFSYLFLQQGKGAGGVALGFLVAYAIHACLQLIFLRLSMKISDKNNTASVSLKKPTKSGNTGV